MIKMSLKKETLYYLLLLLIFIPILFMLINFDRTTNLDYNSYKANFENNWHQFEFAFETLYLIISKFNNNFDFFWTSILILEIIFIIILYSNLKLFLFAIPNLLYLFETLGTQIRFALATLLFLIIFKVFFNRKYFLIISFVTLLFHNANIIVIIVSNYIKIFFDSNTKLYFDIKKVLHILLFMFTLSILIFFTSKLLVVYGYDYYVGTKFQVGRSTSALIFLIFEFFSLVYLLRKNVINNNNFKFVYLGFFLLITSIFLNNYSVISGRITIVYLLIQPFILAFFYEMAKKNINTFIIFLVYLIINIFKVIQKFI
jgi:hypothetical protein